MVGISSGHNHQILSFVLVERRCMDDIERVINPWPIRSGWCGVACPLTKLVDLNPGPATILLLC